MLFRSDRPEQRDVAANAPQRTVPSTPVAGIADENPMVPAATAAATVASSVAIAADGVMAQASPARATVDGVAAGPVEAQAMVSTVSSGMPDTIPPVAIADGPAATADETVRAETASTALEPSAARSAPASLQFDWSSDLIQVETHPEKVRVALAQGQEERPTPRVKRVRPPLTPLSDEPLIQVGTRKPDAENGPLAGPPKSEPTSTVATT